MASARGAPGFNLDRVAEVAGEAAAYALADARSGRRIYVPRMGDPGTELAQIVGAAAAVMLAREFGGLTLTPAKTWRRSTRAARLAAEG